MLGYAYSFVLLTLPHIVVQRTHNRNMVVNHLYLTQVIWFCFSLGLNYVLGTDWSHRFCPIVDSSSRFLQELLLVQYFSGEIFLITISLSQDSLKCLQELLAVQKIVTK